MTTFGIIVATYGDRPHWDAVAERAMASAAAQTWPADAIVRVHDETLAKARNRGSREAGCDWQVFLDADDELDPGYVEAACLGSGDIRVPAVEYRHADGRVEGPGMIARCDITWGNYIVVGAAHRRDAFEAVGGFREYPMFEDWALWLSMHLAGAEIVDCPHALYVAHVNATGRNSARQGLRRRWRDRIRAEVLADSRGRA